MENKKKKFNTIRRNILNYFLLHPLFIFSIQAKLPHHQHSNINPLLTMPINEGSRSLIYSSRRKEKAIFFHSFQFHLVFVFHFLLVNEGQSMEIVHYFLLRKIYLSMKNIIGFSFSTFIEREKQKSLSTSLHRPIQGPSSRTCFTTQCICEKRKTKCS